MGLPSTDKSQIVGNDGYDDHVQHVVKEERDGDGDQDEFSLSFRFLKSFPAVLAILVQSHAHEGQIKVGYAWHFEAFFLLKHKNVFVRLELYNAWFEYVSCQGRQ